ncbi:MAG: hypothetical protein M3O09_15960, partial [Acidobacteriota bacterium]|nr:hypothetical protein [Acidobacteriota bacterium]
LTYTAGFTDPGSLGNYYVYALDPQRKGGTVPYTATLLNPDITNNDALVYLGKITTVGGGGGLGGGGGNGPCCIGSVLSDLYDGTKLPQSELRKGMVLKGVDGGPETIIRIELVPNVPCFRFETTKRVLEGCSSQHTLKGAHYQHAHLFHEGEELLTADGPSRITKKEFIGNRTVYKLTLSHSKTYWTDGFASHNVFK